MLRGSRPIPFLCLEFLQRREDQRTEQEQIVEQLVRSRRKVLFPKRATFMYAAVVFMVTLTLPTA
jgi:hypothetical protein